MSTDTVSSIGSSEAPLAWRMAFVTSSLVSKIASSRIRLGTDPALSRTNRRAATNDVGREDTTRERVDTGLLPVRSAAPERMTPPCSALTLPARKPNIVDPNPRRR